MRELFAPNSFLFFFAISNVHKIVGIFSTIKSPNKSIANKLLCVDTFLSLIKSFSALIEESLSNPLSSIATGCISSAAYSFSF